MRGRPGEPLTELRLRLRRGGYHPLPCEGKATYLKDWPEKLDSSAAEIELWDKTYHLATNTGILAKFTPGLDIDIKDADAAEAVEALAREHFEEHGNILVRIGESPKRLIPLRTDEPFDHLEQIFTAPNGHKHKIEIRADREMWICYGTHPDTRLPYRWHHGELAATAREDLPYVRRGDIETFLDAAARLLADEHGYVAQQGATNGGATPPETWQRLTGGSIHEYRDKAAASVCGHLLRRWVDPYLVAGLLHAWNQAYVRPPLPDHELRRILDRIARLEDRRRDALQGGDRAQTG